MALIVNAGFGRSRSLRPTHALDPITRNQEKPRVLGTPALKKMRVGLTVVRNDILVVGVRVVESKTVSPSDLLLQ
jgi:hypothetical protein